ncbi:hypothetical protein F4860DRAFT_495845 [Xylaria cubensis]|nr:hypothetical protein F4860DRAFT_495845 [Xylaria cubensis]
MAAYFLLYGFYYACARLVFTCCSQLAFWTRQPKDDRKVVTVLSSHRNLTMHEDTSPIHCTISYAAHRHSQTSLPSFSHG